MILHGMYQSNLEGIEDASRFLASVDLPDVYDLSEQTRPMIDQGNQGICVSVALGDMITFWSKTRNQETIVHTDYFYKRREDKTKDGMTPREAFEIGKKDFGYKMFAKIQDPLTMRKAIISNGPCMICLPCYNGDTEFWKGYELQGGHAVVLTGFDKSGFILKNSWGWQYGNAGYTHFQEEDWKYLYEAWTLIN